MTLKFRILAGSALAGLLVVTAIAQVITLALEARNQQWLNQLDAGWQFSDAVRALREKSIRFLHPNLDAVPVPSAAQSLVLSDQPVAAQERLAPTTDFGAFRGPAVVDENAGGQTPASAPSPFPSEPAPQRQTSVDPEPDQAPDSIPSSGSSRRRLLLFGVRAWMMGFGGLLVAAVLAFAWQWAVLPSTAQTQLLARSAHVQLHKSGGDQPQLELLGTRYRYSLNTRIENISEHFVNAVIASEDHRFFEHGISDFQSLTFVNFT